MDVLFFLKGRINFIRQLYSTASAPYVERKPKIEAEEDPFVPPYSEDGEPPFLEESLEADESLHVLAYSSISMLAAALHLYLETWVKQTGVPIDDLLKQSVFKKSGWFAGYKTHFARRFAITFEAGPAKLERLGEVVLARNRIVHPSSITSQKTQYADTDLNKLRHPFFVDEREAPLFADADEGEKTWFIPPNVHVAEEQLFAALSEVERFAEWFEVEIENRVYAR